MRKVSIIFTGVILWIVIGGMVLGCEGINNYIEVTPPIYTKPIDPIIVDTLQFPRKGESPATTLVQLYSTSTQNLNIAIYSLTHPKIVQGILDTKKRGVLVRIITDKVQAAGSTQKHAMNSLLDAKIPIKYETHAGLMHLKMSIVDTKVATTGSYNYSTSAEGDNDEMFLVITQPDFVIRCLSEFERLWVSKDFLPLGIQ